VPAPRRISQPKRPTTAEQAQAFKEAQQQMKADAARRRAEAEARKAEDDDDRGGALGS